MLDKILDSKILEKGYEDALQPGLKKVGQALETIAGILPTVLIPIKLVNDFGNKWYLSYAKKIGLIPSDNIIDVQPEIGIPILEKLSYFRNHDISELFVNLLVTASSIETVKFAHPGFISTISSLSVDEARIINFLNQNKLDRIVYVYFQMVNIQDNALAYTQEPRHTGLEKKIEFLFPENTRLYLQNLIGLGIIEKYDDLYYPEDNPLYMELEEMYEDLRAPFEEAARETLSQLYTSRIAKGYYKVTDYGQAFVKACAGENVPLAEV